MAPLVEGKGLNVCIKIQFYYCLLPQQIFNNFFYDYNNIFTVKTWKWDKKCKPLQPPSIFDKGWIKSRKYPGKTTPCA